MQIITAEGGASDGLLHRGVVLYRGGVVFSVSLDLDTKTGLGKTLVQNDHVYSENKVLFCTHALVLSFGLNQTKEKGIHMNTQLSSRLKF